MSSSVRTQNMKNNMTNGGYFISFILTSRINKGCNIIEIPLLTKDLVEHKVLITDGVIPINGIVIQQKYIFLLTDIPVYYMPGAQVYILTEKYKQYALPAIYSKYKQTLIDVMYYMRKIKGTSLNISMRFNVDYDAIAGTPELSDILESNFIRTLSDALNIDSKQIVITEISSGSVIIVFMIIENPDAISQAPFNIGEEIKFQLSKKNSKLYTDQLFRKAISINISVIVKDLSINDPGYLFLRDYNVNIYEKIINDEIDVIGDIFEFLSITI